MEKWKYAGESLGISIGKIWYRKKYRCIRFYAVVVNISGKINVSNWKKYQYQYRKILVPEKVSVSVLVNILGTVTHWLMLVGARDAYTSEKESES